MMSKIKLALDVVSDLKALAESIEVLVHAMESNEPVEDNQTAEIPAKEPVKKKSKTKAKVEELVVEDQENEEVPENIPEEKQPTLEEVRAAMADKSRDGHREAVKAILTKYGANNLSSLDTKHYEAALKEVGDIK